MLGELLSAVRDRLAVLLDMNEEDIKLYPYMTEEKKQAYFQQCEVGIIHVIMSLLCYRHISC